MKTRLTHTLIAAVLLVLGGAVTAIAQTVVTDRSDDAFRKYSKRFFGPGFDWRVFKAQGMTESNLDSTAKSWVGARGILQLMPSTFKEVRSKNPEIEAVNDAEWNIAAGICYDRQLWNQWTEQSEHKDRQRFMLGSYNAGRGTVL